MRVESEPSVKRARSTSEIPPAATTTAAAGNRHFYGTSTTNVPVLFYFTDHTSIVSVLDYCSYLGISSLTSKVNSREWYGSTTTIL